VLRIDRTVRASVAATPEQCLDFLGDVERYPAWSSLIESADRVGDLIHLRASVLGVGFEMDCELLLRSGAAVLRRVPEDDADEERFEATWKLTPGYVELHVQAVLEAPGPARLIRGRVEKRIADDLLADFARALSDPG
jgi:hypothetical protein